MEIFLQHPWKLLSMGLLLAASAFFSSAETALFALPPRTLAEFRKSGGPFRRLAARLMRDSGSTVISILFGNMTVNVLFYALGSYFFYEAASPGLSGALALGTLLTVVIFGEVVPKTVAFAHARRWAPIAAGPIYAVHILVLPIRLLLLHGLVRPVARLLTGGRDQLRRRPTLRELRALVSATAREGQISPDEHALLHEVIQLGELIVRDVMVPRVDMIAVDVRCPTRRFLRTVRRHRLTKLPVYEGDPDHVLGLVYAREAFLNPGKPLTELARPVQFVPELSPVEALLEQFRRTRTQFAVAVDEYGGVAGIVTLEDIVEELVGQIGHRRGDAGPALVQLNQVTWRASGALAMHEWAERFGEDPSEGRCATLGGYVTGLLGRPAVSGDRAADQGFEFTVETVRRRRILRVRIRRLETGGLAEDRQGGGR